MAEGWGFALKVVFYFRIAFLPIILRLFSARALARWGVAMGLQISYKYKNRWKIRQLDGDSALIGRPNAQSPVDIDLSPDTTVSRNHARIWAEGGAFWVEDLKSRYGTKFNDSKLKGKVQVKEGDTIQVGETTLKIDALPEHSE